MKSLWIAKGAKIETGKSFMALESRNEKLACILFFEILPETHFNHPHSPRRKIDGVFPFI